MTIHPSIARIHAKLEALRLADPQLALFGAATHEYLLAPVKTPAEVSEFERHAISGWITIAAMAASIRTPHSGKADASLSWRGMNCGSIHRCGKRDKQG
ncbi:hypothetical protein [Massilia aquatica]|uniref:hypothetical protein n=1 Tax=Massilia aquatica TaxID=2609000 RepID=UPI0018C8A4FC|nr:hypothetical protein [Massilia aquatica]